MKNILILVVCFLAISCGKEDSGSVPGEVMALAAKAVVLDDVSNEGNPSDLEVSFDKADDETGIAIYRICF